MTSFLNGIFIFFGVVFIAIVLIIVILQNLRPSAIVSLTPNDGSLSVPTMLGSPGQVRSLFFTSPSSTFTVYVYCNAVDKTPKLNMLNPTVLFQFGPSVQFTINPAGASTRSTTQLIVQTQGQTVITEKIDIPPFPTQKWVYLGIVKEGRRFTIYYNGVAVSSHRTTYFPVISSNPLTIGDPKINGRFMEPNLVGTALTATEMKNFRTISTDSRYKPNEKSTTIFSILSLISFGCPDGVFCFSTSGTPSNNPLLSWKSSYA